MTQQRINEMIRKKNYSCNKNFYQLFDDAFWRKNNTINIIAEEISL